MPLLQLVRIVILTGTLLWASNLGAQTLRWLGNQCPDSVGTRANDISADGRTIVGTAFRPGESAFRWRDNAYAGIPLKEANALTPDGKVIMGLSLPSPGGGLIRPAQWSEDGTPTPRARACSLLSGIR